jgi:hypothetical protein
MNSIGDGEEGRACIPHSAVSGRQQPRNNRIYLAALRQDDNPYADEIAQAFGAE